ncbi:MAG: aromatic ring-hydroxylating dioxygenase subunit alpha [Bradyrhizobium sp.]|nr:aromatic ring-hydroxylating dioxygenase subunit alpha [Bradyrhizobium sp.]
MNATSNIDRSRSLLSQSLTYPRNQWYVAAGRSEVGRKPLARKLLGKHVVLFRTEAGDPVAMTDWCPHRGFRFSNSKLVGDTIECGYHGMRFGANGACVHIPSQESIPPKMAVTTYPLVERREFIWIWLGDIEKMDIALLPAELEFENPAHASSYIGTLDVASNAAVAMENVIDITHASLLHPGILDTDSWELMTTRDEVETIAPTIIQTTKRFGKMAVKGYLAQTMGVAENDVVDRVRIARQYLPGLHTSTDSYYDPEDSSKVLARRIRYVGITPQDERSCLIFAAYSGTFQYTEASRQIGLATLHQDVIALESTQAYFEQGGAQFKELSVLADQAAMTARRIISRLAAQEA